jgi:hypothetical protein
MAAPPCDERAHVVIGEVGDELVLAEERDEERKPLPDVVAGSVVLCLCPESTSNVVELERRASRLDLGDVLLRPLALGALYGFGLTPDRGFGAAVKAMTPAPEVELPIRRARVFIDGHVGASLRV